LSISAKTESISEFLISSFTMRAVGRAAWKMVQEVRRQFKDIPGLMEGKTEPDYARCIEISTKSALVEMLLPGIITIISPVVIVFAFGAQGKMALGGFLAGSLGTGVLLAVIQRSAESPEQAQRRIAAQYHYRIAVPYPPEFRIDH